MLQVTSIYIKLNEDYNSNLLALASITFNNCFIIKDIELRKNKIYDEKENNKKYYIRFPENKKRKAIVHPIVEDLRQNIELNIINKYEYIRRKKDENLSGDYK